jgi:hypothetical protein
MAEFVVIDADGRFLSGPRMWSHEYPDARLFTSASVAIAAAKRAGVLCEVVSDYGVETQRTIETVGLGIKNL